MAVDRSKRYANSPKGAKGDKKGSDKSLQTKPEEGAEKAAEKTAGDPPSVEDPKGANHTPDKGPEPGHGPAFGEVAERHKNEMGVMHKRHSEEMGSMHERHAKDHDELRKRHMKELEAPNKEEAGAESAAEKSGKGPKLGKTEDKGEKGTG